MANDDVTGDVTGELTARSPGRILEDAARIARILAANGRARPQVELWLESGHTVRGHLVELGEGDDRIGAVAVIHVEGTPRAPAVAYVPVRHVVGVMVGDASLLVRAPVSDAPPPSRLELARQIAARGEPMAGRLGRTIPVAIGGELDDAGRRAIGGLLPVLFDTLAAIAGDELGRDALAAVSSIDVAAGTAGEVAFAGGALAIRAPVLLGDAFTSGSLRTAIEKLL